MMDPHLAELEARIDSGETASRRFATGGGAVIVKDHAIRRTRGGLPVSRTLPLKAGGTVVSEGGARIKVHADGIRTDLSGRVIVASRADADRVQKVYGVERE